jgi:hypothetical protein
MVASPDFIAPLVPNGTPAAGPLPFASHDVDASPEVAGR